MSWPFLHVNRRTFRSADNWGTLYMITLNGTWERVSYTFERPWFTNASGKSQETLKDKKTGKDVPGSRIREGIFELTPRSDGEKGWRLELLGTEHRSAIEVHRAHRSLYIEGCILPVSFIDFREETSSGTLVRQIRQGDQKAITEPSVRIMAVIKQRYDLLSEKHRGEGRPTIVIAAYLPPLYRLKAEETAFA